MTLKQVPASCCKSNLTDCSSANPVAVSEIWTEDCFVVGLSFVQEHAVYLAGVALGISSLMVGGKILGEEDRFRLPPMGFSPSETRLEIFFDFQLISCLNKEI